LLQARVAVGFVLQNLYQQSAIEVTAGSIAIISFHVLNETIPTWNIIEKKNNETPFSSQKLKEMADKIESIRVDNLWCYNVATSNTKVSH
jgi:chorismate synthase